MTGSEHFGRSALVAEMHSQVEPDHFRPHLRPLLSALGENTPELLKELEGASVNKMALSALMYWAAFITPHPKRDRIGREAVKFFAAQALVTTVMRSSLLKLDTPTSPGLIRALEHGADALFEVGRSQFEMLARVLTDLANWIAERAPKSVAIIESPIGNSLPVQILCELLQRKGVHVNVEVWNAPRNDRASRGRTIDSAAEVCAENTSGADYVILIDETRPGSRFIKLLSALSKHIDGTRLLPLAMVFRDTAAPSEQKNDPSVRLKTKLKKCSAAVGYPRYWTEFPSLRLFIIDEGQPIKWCTPVIWADSDLIAGKRKVNLIFSLLEHLFYVIGDLGKPQSVFRPYLAQAWSLDTSGRETNFAEGLLERTFHAAAENLPLDTLKNDMHHKAKAQFPDEYIGNIHHLDEDGVCKQLEWLKSTFTVSATITVGSELAWTIWNAFDVVFAAALPNHPPSLSRDTDVAPFILPFNDNVRAFNLRLRHQIMNVLADDI